MSRKSRIKELEVQIKNLKTRNNHLVRASNNNHNGLLYWKEQHYFLKQELLGLKENIDDAIEFTGV